jgi:carbamoyltransferase
VVLAERAEEIFEGNEESPFMLLAKRVRPEWRETIPAIVHIDGTARVQTVREEHNQVLYRLLKAFDAITGVPVLLNTSFNVKGEPIVESPRDAIACFLTTGVDFLALHDVFIAKGPLYKFVSPIVKVYSDVRMMMMTGVQTD